MSQRNLREAVLTVGGVIVKIGEGNITFSEKRNIEYIRDRGEIDTVRLGDDEPVDVSFDFMWEWIEKNSSDQDLRSVITGEGGETSSGDSCEPYACDITLVFTACSITETITLADFRWEEISYDGRAGTISCSGKCNIAAPAFS